MQTPGPAPKAAHWLSLLHSVHRLALPQIGVSPEQLALLRHWTHWPMSVPLVAQMGLLPVQGPTTPASIAPPSLAPPSLPPLPPALAPGVLQPTQRLATQKAFAAVGQSRFWIHSTQRPETGSHIGASPEHTPPSPVAAAQETQVLIAEQKGVPAVLLQWSLVRQATHWLFTQ
jgi:hypothetical protein